MKPPPKKTSWLTILGWCMGIAGALAAALFLTSELEEEPTAPTGPEQEWPLFDTIVTASDILSLSNRVAAIEARLGTDTSKRRYYVSYAYIKPPPRPGQQPVMSAGSRLITCDGRIETDDDLRRLRLYLADTVGRRCMLLGWQELCLIPTYQKISGAPAQPPAVRVRPATNAPASPPSP